MAKRPPPKTQTVISFVLNDCTAQVNKTDNGLVIIVEPDNANTQSDKSTEDSSASSRL